MACPGLTELKVTEAVALGELGAGLVELLDGADGGGADVDEDHLTQRRALDHVHNALVLCDATAR